MQVYDGNFNFLLLKLWKINEQILSEPCNRGREEEGGCVHHQNTSAVMYEKT